MKCDQFTHPTMDDSLFLVWLMESNYFCVVLFNMYNYCLYSYNNDSSQSSQVKSNLFSNNIISHNIYSNNNQ